MSKPKTPGEMTDAELDAAIALELFDGDKPVFAPADLAGNPFPVPTRRFSTDPALTLPLIEKARRVAAEQGWPVLEDRARVEADCRAATIAWPVAPSTRERKTKMSERLKALNIELPAQKPRPDLAAAQIVIDAIREAGVDPQKAACVPIVPSMAAEWVKGGWTRQQFIANLKKILILNPSLALR